MRKQTYCNKVTAWFLTLAMLMTFLPNFTITVSAAEKDTWDGTMASQAWDSGSGTEENPYIIMTAAQLAKLASNVNNGTKYTDTYFKLGTNLDLNGSEKKWTSIGKYSSSQPSTSPYFDGYFDGNGKTISNISKLATSMYALFGNLGTNGKVTGLDVSNVSITTGSYAAGLVYNNKGTVEKCTVSNVTITTKSYASGLIYNNYGTVNDCVATNISITSKYVVAGIVGENQGAITNCKVASGTITGSNPGASMDSWVGGICGTAKGGTIRGCLNAATVSAEAGRYCSAAGIVAGPYRNDSNESAIVTGCANAGTVLSSKYAGGISGKYQTAVYMNITLSYNTGSINGSIAGGISAVGSTNKADKILNCYNAGVVTGSSYAAGITADKGNEIIENTHNYAKIVSDGVAGPIIAMDSDTWPGKDKLINNHAIEGNAQAPYICSYLDTKDASSSRYAVTVGSTKADFNNGTIYQALQNANGETQVWKQTIGTNEYPVFFNDSNAPVSHTHEFAYTANGNIITETCNSGCEHSETATLKVSTSEVVYDGTAKEGASVLYSEGWKGGELSIVYENNINAGTATAKITKKEATAFINFVINTAEPNEELPAGLTATYGDTLADVSLPSGWIWKDSSLSVGNAGSKTFKAVFTPNNSNFKIIETDVTVVVEQANPTYTAPTGLTATYGSSFHAISLPEGWSWRAPTAKVGDVGVHQYSAYYTPTDSNYKQVLVELTVTVTKAPLTVKANDHRIVYGDAPTNNGVEYDGLAFGEDESVLNGTLIYEYSYSRYGNVGIYDIIPKGLTADNYEITFQKGVLTVEQKVLDIEWSNTEVVYNGKEQAPTATPIGAVNGDQISIEVSTAKDAYSYTVVVFGIRGIKADNYKLVRPVVTHSFTILPRELTISWGNSSFAYDGTGKFPEIFLNGVVTGDDVQVVTSGTQVNASDNPYTATIVKLSGNDADNYKLAGVLTKEFYISKVAYSAPVGLTKTDETISRKNDGTISGITATMEYRREDESVYQGVNSSILENLKPGKYYIRYQGDDNHVPSPDTVITISKGRKLTVTVPQNQKGYTLKVDKTEIDYMDGPTITLHIAEGYAKTDNFAVKIDGVDIGWGDWDELATQSFTADAVITVEGVADITAPTAEIDVKGNKWTSFLNTITFGLFFNDTQDVVITAEDKGSGIATIHYFLSNRVLSEAELRDITQWTLYDGIFKINPDDQFVIYVKITDSAGNVTYISSDGVILDAVAAQLIGVEDKGIYYGDTTMTVTDELAGIQAVTVDGEVVTLNEGRFTIVADNKTHAIRVIDKAGNEVEYQVTVYKTYLVTYKADDHVVATITVGYGKDAVAPEIPSKDGYDQTAPVWDKDGQYITSDTIINAIYTKNPSNNKPVAPETGDNSSYWAWLLIISATGVLILSYKKRYHSMNS